MVFRKGQVTIFVIIGLLLLIIVGIFIYISSPEVDIEEPIRRQYDSRLDNVVLSVERCMYLLARDAFEELGSTGGFFNLDSDRYIFGVSPAYVNNAVELFPESGFVVPYWFGSSSSPNCEECSFYLNKPSLMGAHSGSIASQVEDYVSDNLLVCLDYFSVFNDTFDITWEDDPVAIINFYDEHTEVVVDWELDALLVGTDLTLYADIFSADLDLRMKKIYGLASDLLYQSIISRGALEEFSLEVSSLLGSGGRDAVIPPRAGGVYYDFSAPRIWRKSDIRNVLSEAFSDYISFMQVFGSYESYSITPGSTDLFTETIVSGFSQVVSSDFDQIVSTRVRFNYFPSWPLYVDVHPSLGEVVMPRSGSILAIPFFPISYSQYDFDYDISYPVLVTLEDITAFGGEGYLFQFAAESNIRRSARYYDDIEIVGEAEEHGFDSGFGEFIFRDVPVTISVLDAFTLEPVEGVEVMYTCVDATVGVGVSEMVNGRAVIESYLPQCVSGVFRSMGSFHSEVLIESIVEGENNEFNLRVYTEQDIRVYPVKRMLGKVPVFSEEDLSIEWDWSLSGGEYYSRFADEETIILFMRLEDGEPGSFVRTASINGSVQEYAEVSLIPGKYDVFVFSNLHMGEGHSIEYLETEKEEFCYRNPPLIGSKKCEVIPGERINDTLIIGFLQLDSSTSGPVEITMDDLRKSTMKLYFASYRLEDLVLTRDLEVIGAMVEASESHRSLLLPVFE